MRVPLLIGPLDVPGFSVRRSGIRWLRGEGARVKPGETIAYCNIGFHPAAQEPHPFPDEQRDFQVAFVTPVGGVLRQEAAGSRGGWFDLLEVFLWGADFAIGAIEVESADGLIEGGVELRLLMMAGRRATELAEVRSGLLTGWHARSRAWRVESDRPISTLLSLGICELDGVIKGEGSDFVDIFHDIEGPAQVIHVPDTPLVPSARYLSEQLTRTPEQHDEISRDLTTALATGSALASPEDWMFAAAVLQGLKTNPLMERRHVLTRAGIRQAGPPDAIVLSLNSETTTLFRHKRLGYTCWFHAYRRAHFGPALINWIRSEFDFVQRTTDDLRQDYINFIDLIRARSPQIQILIHNRISSDGHEDLQSYAGFDLPLHETLTNVESKERNLMLLDLARERDIAIIDADSIAADLGARDHLQGGMHQSGAMQAELRKEILRILRARGVPGF